MQMRDIDACKGRGPQTAPSVLDSVMEIDVAGSPPDGAAAERAQAADAAEGLPGVWTRCSALAAALRMIMGAAAKASPSLATDFGPVGT